VDQAPLGQKTIMITGASRRIGRALAVASAAAGANVIIHYAHSKESAEETRRLVVQQGRQAWMLQADFLRPDDVHRLADAAFSLGPVHALVNNAAIFGPAGLAGTGLQDWENHMAINLRAPFVLAQAFGRALGPHTEGRIVNILDWRAMHPGSDHFAYTVSKAALAAMTKSLARALAPRISVNGLALGAVLPPEGSQMDPGIIQRVPARRWGTLDEVAHALIFLLAGPAYVTGEVIYVDGGRHLT
jgi:NAD(P)-dependent dehydrogenase (short-subunit alcohol dehydrogenase family)